jgi:hypothetical protein
VILKKRYVAARSHSFPEISLQFIAAQVPCTYANSLGSRFSGNSHPLISTEFCRNREQALPTVQQTYNKRSETAPSFVVLHRRMPTHAESCLLTFQQGT